MSASPFSDGRRVMQSPRYGKVIFVTPPRCPAPDVWADFEQRAISAGYVGVIAGEVIWPSEGAAK